MALLDDVLSQVAGGGQNAGLARAAMEMLGSKGAGGLAGLTQLFGQKGLADVAASWISTGANLPISADQLQGVLGNDAIGQLAAKAGLTPQAAGGALAQMLPDLVDKLTPSGEVQGSPLEQVRGMLTGPRG
jgi:uncharacterized protein YidB (DUF937 family)